MLSQHETLLPSRQELADQGHAPVDYSVSFPGDAHLPCPVQNLLRRHFAERHPLDTLRIAGEISSPCPMCGMQVTPFGFNRGHMNSALCRGIAQRKKQKEIIRANLEASERRFMVAGSELECVESFRYLGRPLSATDSDWLAIRRNLNRARQKWAMISRILSREGATPRVSGLFYKAVVQSVLLYGSETWVLDKAKLQALSGFHNRVARRLSGRMPRFRPGPGAGTWEYPPIEEALEIAGLFTLEEYILRRRGTILAQVQQRPIYRLCQEALRLQGSPVGTKYWWEQPFAAEQ